MVDLAGLPRDDANRLAIQLARDILAAAHDVELDVEGKRVRIATAPLAPPAWPAAGVEGLSIEADGPWPVPVRLSVTWDDGSAELVMQARHWMTKGDYRHLIGFGVAVAKTRQNVLWITLPLPLMSDEGPIVSFAASISASRKQGVSEAQAAALTKQLRDVVAKTGLPLASEANVAAFSVDVEGRAILPSATEAFERLVTVAVLKLPFLARDGQGVEGAPLIAVGKDEVSSDVAEPRATLSGKRAGVWPLPGGVRGFKATLDVLLTELSQRSHSLDEFYGLLKSRYDVTGDTSRKGYLGMLTGLGVCTVRAGRVEISEAGRSYIAEPTALALFGRLHGIYAGILDTLVIASVLGTASGARSSQLLQALLGTSWKTDGQTTNRRNWLLSLGLTDRKAEGDEVTELGREALELFRSDVMEIKQRLEPLLGDIVLDPDEADDEANDDDASDVSPGLEDVQPRAEHEPAAWRADRVDLSADRVAPFASLLTLPTATIAAAAAALSAGKHLLLVGPPGTGKTELAHAIIEAARSEGYCAGGFVATASADWTTFDTIGGYALQKSGELRFRSGALLRAIEGWRWLVIDELNRADVDRAFGELMTVLAGRTTDTAYELDDGRTVRIGPDPHATHPMPKTFRVIATMNTWDKTSLFRLSYAVQRRFAIIHVGAPEEQGFAELLRAHCLQEGVDAPLAAADAALVVDLFSSARLRGVRPIGPAAILDLIRFVRRRATGGFTAGDAIAESLPMYVLPQLEGLEQDAALRAHAVVAEALASAASPLARSELTARFADLFPHVVFA